MSLPSEATQADEVRDCDCYWYSGTVSLECNKFGSQFALKLDSELNLQA